MIKLLSRFLRFLLTLIEGPKLMPIDRTTNQQFLVTSDLSGLMTGQLSALSTADILALNASQAQTLTSTQVAALTSDQATALGTVLQGLTTSQVQALVTTDIAGLATSQIAALSPEDVPPQTPAVGRPTEDALADLRATRLAHRQALKAAAELQGQDALSDALVFVQKAASDTGDKISAIASEVRTGMQAYLAGIEAELSDAEDEVAQGLGWLQGVGKNIVSGAEKVLKVIEGGV